MSKFTVTFVGVARPNRSRSIEAATHIRALDAFEEQRELLTGFALPDESLAIVSGKGERRAYVNPYGFWERDDSALDGPFY